MSGRTIPIHPDSRAATNALLADLRRANWCAGAWWRFARAAAARSAAEAIARPRAVAEVTLVHGMVLAASRGHGRTWVVTSWLLCLTHLGMLGDRSSIGPATAVTLVRANLPATRAEWGRWLGSLALVTDVADGHLARRLHAESMFGGYADALADAAFWTWFALKHEPDRRVRTAAVIAWAVPVCGAAVASVARGRMVDLPRSSILRPAAALQAMLAARAAFRSPA